MTARRNSLTVSIRWRTPPDVTAFFGGRSVAAGSRPRVRDHTCRVIRFGRKGQQAGPPSKPGPSPGDQMPKIAGYGELTVIGHGASATVYRAVQEGFDRSVALKVLNIDISDRRAQRRFQRERSLNGRLSSHPNVVTVLDSGFVDGRYPYLAMELFDQGSLTQQIKDRGPFAVAKALHVGVRIAGALESAHRLGVLHRDVKPQNILESRFGEPALADFGIASILEMDQSLTMALTPVHAAPEILEGGEPTASTDVYALASTIYTMLTGSPPFAGPPGEGMLKQLLRITTSDLPTIARSDVPPSLIELLRQATAKRPELRPESAAAFGGSLQRIQTELGLARTELPVDDTGAPPSPISLDDDWTDTATPSPMVESVLKPATPFPAPESSTRSPLPPPSFPEPLLPVAATAVPVETATVPAAMHAIAIDDSTVDPHVDDPTISARQVIAPAAVAEPTRRPWVLPVASGVAVLAGVGLALAMFTNTNAKGTSATISSTPPVSSTAAPDLSVFAATDLTSSISGGNVLLRWTDRGNGKLQYSVRAFPPGLNVAPDVTKKGASSAIVSVDVTQKACFVVDTLLRPEGKDLMFLRSNVTCINGGDPAMVPAAPNGAAVSTTSPATSAVSTSSPPPP
jgi:serine/threonine-protein kinase PknK